ncbi:MAG: thioesterase family protein [Planctomycetota bacterium]
MTPDVPTSGSIRVRVRYCECDPMGVAHHASYAPWMEMARTELLRTGGVTYAQLEREGVFLVVTKLEVRYRRPIRYDDEVEIRCRVVGGGGGSKVKVRHEYELVLVGAGDGNDARLVDRGGQCSVATTELACVTGEGRVRELPHWLIPKGS